MTGACHQQLPAIVASNLRDGDLGPGDNGFHIYSDNESEDNDASEGGFRVEESGNNPQFVTGAVYQSIKDRKS